MKIHLRNEADQGNFSDPDYFVLDLSEIDIDDLKKKAEHIHNSGALYLQYPCTAGHWMQAQNWDEIKPGILDLGPVDPRWDTVAGVCKDEHIKDKELRVGKGLDQKLCVRWMGYTSAYYRPVFTEWVLLEDLEALLQPKTVKIKTAELSGLALDWAVGHAQGQELCSVGWLLHIAAHFRSNQEVVPVWSPSTLWEQGGLIIERERISVIRNKSGVWHSTLRFGTDWRVDAFGNTPLVAAMRCYVFRKLGDEVMVPADILQGDRQWQT